MKNILYGLVYARNWIEQRLMWNTLNSEGFITGFLLQADGQTCKGSDNLKGCWYKIFPGLSIMFERLSS